MKVVSLFGFALRFLAVGVAVGVGLGVGAGALLDRSAAVYISIGSGILALVLVRPAVSLAVRPKLSESRTPRPTRQGPTHP